MFEVSGQVLPQPVFRFITDGQGRHCCLLFTDHSLHISSLQSEGVVLNLKQVDDAVFLYVSAGNPGEVSDPLDDLYVHKAAAYLVTLRRGSQNDTIEIWSLEDDRGRIHLQFDQHHGQQVTIPRNVRFHCPGNAVA